VRCSRCLWKLWDVKVGRVCGLHCVAIGYTNKEALSGGLFVDTVAGCGKEVASGASVGDA